jgi:Type I restriction enzyme R protein N terminus (HSDR_N)
MVTIVFPPPSFKIEKKEGREHIFDAGRKKWLLLTPEEWVRQNFLQYLLQVKKYPAALIAIEKEIKLGELNKRFDILVYNAHHQPWMMIECKAMEVELDEGVLQQVLRYNIGVPVEYLVITNGRHCMAWQRNKGQLQPIKELPEHNC